jgi:predicted nucleic acid-binding protein
MKLVDSCVWIDFLKSGNNSELDELIRSGQAAVCGTIIAEVLSGVRNESQAKSLEKRLRAINYLPESSEDFVRAAFLYRTLRRKGSTVPLSDCLIAAVCLNNEVEILTFDRHFKAFNKRTLAPVSH